MKKLCARDVMTREIHTLCGDATLQKVAALMNEKNISGVPIVSAEGKLRGLITESDLLNEARRKNAVPRLGFFGLYGLPEERIIQIYRNGWNLPAEDYMTRKLVTAREETPLEEISRLLVKHKINRVPIVDENQLLQGIVTREDVLRGIVQSWNK